MMNSSQHPGDEQRPPRNERERAEQRREEVAAQAKPAKPGLQPGDTKPAEQRQDATAGSAPNRKRDNPAATPLRAANKPAR
jgi:hypothetical protein